MPLPRRRRLVFQRKSFADRRAVSAVEAAIILPVFLLLLLFLFEVAYDQFLQGVLESTLQYTAYQMQVDAPSTIGGATTAIDNSSGAQAFVDNDLCPNAIAHLLGCSNLYVRVQQFESASCPDFWQATDGTLPVSGGKLQLGDFAGENPGSGSQQGPTNCESAASTGGVGYCNPGPNEFVIMTVVYIAPTFLYSLMPGQGYTYGGSSVHAAYATSAFYTENFAAPTNPVLPC
jgi:hypothetical protein